MKSLEVRNMGYKEVYGGTKCQLTFKGWLDDKRVYGNSYLSFEKDVPKYFMIHTVIGEDLGVIAIVSSRDCVVKMDYSHQIKDGCKTGNLEITSDYQFTVTRLPYDYKMSVTEKEDSIRVWKEYRIYRVSDETTIKYTVDSLV